LTLQLRVSGSPFYFRIFFRSGFSEILRRWLAARPIAEKLRLLDSSNIAASPAFFPSSFILTLRLASVSALKFEAIYKKEKSKTGQRVAAIIEGKIMNLSIEAKVAIAVATGLVVLIVGAMAQG
jgi:hypothetical protein